MNSGNRVLVLFAHPSLQKSRVNRALAAAVKELPGVTFHDLYETYPEMFIKAEREKELLVAHDVIVFQHPFYWYSSPAILKEWQDIVLEYGFAYGENGTALQGKQMLTAITTGGLPEDYRPEGIHRFSIREFLAPFEQTARLCGMRYLDPFVVQGSLNLSKEEIAAHAQSYRTLIEKLRDEAGGASASETQPSEEKS